MWRCKESRGTRIGQRMCILGILRKLCGLGCWAHHMTHLSHHHVRRFSPAHTHERARTHTCAHPARMQAQDAQHAKEHSKIRFEGSSRRMHTKLTAQPSRSPLFIQGKGEDAGRVSSARNPRTPERGADDWSKHMQTPANHRSSSASTDPIDGLSGSHCHKLMSRKCFTDASLPGLESVRSQPKSVANVEEPVGRAGIGILFERYSFAHGCR